MIGFLIQNESGQYLTRNHGWLGSNPEESFVFSESQVKFIRQFSYEWDVKPAKIIPARYENGKVVVTGESLPFLEGR